MLADPRSGRRRRCYLVRHGHADYFDAHARPLDPRTVRLSSTGMQQAWALGQVMQTLQFDRALCSYPRAMQTFDLLLIRYQASVDVPPELREIRAGRLKDIPAEHHHRRVP